MSAYGYIGVVVAVIVVITFVAYALFSKRKNESSNSGPKDFSHIDCTRLQAYIDIYEKRVLAYLVDEEAKNLGFDYPKRKSLRAEYGEELSFPPYSAQEWLSERGVSYADISRMQRAWIAQNGGNPDSRPTSREVVRILNMRNVAKAENVCCNSIS